MNAEDKKILKVIKDNFKMAQLNVETKCYVLITSEFTAFIPVNCVNSEVGELIVQSSINTNNGRQYVRIMKVNTVKISWKL
jgi:hypothetical protein|nr:MAG TPA: hypothetical protein [Crassvirales sp.]